MRSALLAISIALACASTSACADVPAASPPLESLDVRATLALSARAAGAFSAADRARARVAIDAAVAARAKDADAAPADPDAVPASPRVVLALAKDVRAAIALDAERRARGEAPIVAATIAHGRVTPLSVAAIFVAPSEARPLFAPALPSPPSDEAAALFGVALPHAANASAHASAKTSDTKLVAVPYAPFALLYGADDDTLYVNPAVVALLHDPAEAFWATAFSDRHTETKDCAYDDAPCLADAMSLVAVRECVRGAAPACVPPAGVSYPALLGTTPSCAWVTQACIGDPVLYSACSPVPGKLREPCSANGGRGGEACGRLCGESYTTLCCDATGLTKACDDFSAGCHCGSSCTAETRTACAHCGSQCGTSSTRECTRACGESSTCTTETCVRGEDPPRPPPPPPMDAAHGPPERSLVLTGSRDLAFFALPPLACIALWRRARRANLRAHGAPMPPALHSPPSPPEMPR